MSGPYVIVNRYAGCCWTGNDMLPCQYPTIAAAKQDIRNVFQTDKQVLDCDERTIMPLAQFLIEYGT